MKGALLVFLLLLHVATAERKALDVMAATGATVSGVPPVHDFRTDQPNRIYGLDGADTRDFLSNVEQSKGFVLVVSIKPPAEPQVGTLLSIDTPESHRPAHMRLFYDSRVSSVCLEYSVKGNSVVVTFSHVVLNPDRFHRIVLLVHELRAALYADCELMGEQVLRGPIYDTQFEKNMQLRIGQTTAYMRSRPPFKGLMKNMEFIFSMTKLSHKTLGEECDLGQKSKFVINLQNIYGCHDCPILQQLVDFVDYLQEEANKTSRASTLKEVCFDGKHYYPEGSTYVDPADPCLNCTCGKHGIATCAVMKCPPLDDKCLNPYLSHGKCCPTCFAETENVAVTWSSWVGWTTCSKTCGGGDQVRRRSCDRLTGFPGGHNCTGLKAETRLCNVHRCPVHGNWGSWSSMTECSVTCEKGVHTRSRTCSNPSPRHGGRNCTGPAAQISECVLPECPNPCKAKPCWGEVKCHRLSETKFECDPCPLGYRGDGITCKDINECKETAPCFSGVRCANKRGSFRCNHCPSGYSGHRTKGKGIAQAIARKQVCTDIDECAVNNGGCRHSACINKIGGFECGPCYPGYSREGRSDGQCILVNICPLGWHDCRGNFKCRPYGNLSFICVCPEIGHYFKDGLCIVDTDLDRYPDEDIANCTFGKYCKRDNCPTVPNSGQEDKDGDGLGDACDDDDDNDGVNDEEDNCYLTPNDEQGDDDGDEVGNYCDNCPALSNPLQQDYDQDGLGDACDPDPDDDGVLGWIADNCPLVSNAIQRDSDGDGVGDHCDNCPYVPNAGQSDEDQDMVGDVCDYDEDEDMDGRQDDLDLCHKVANANQCDHDQDGFGDACDDDDDNDGVPDKVDNCPIRANRNQQDLNMDGVGDICEVDFDGDTYPDDVDVCPFDKEIDRTDFTLFQRINLMNNPDMPPRWRIQARGAEVVQSADSDPALAVGYHYFDGVDFNGTFFVNTDKDDDYAGFAFSFQSNRRFYAVMWKRSSETYGSKKPFSAHAKAGLQIKLVKSVSGPGARLRNALWHTGNTPKEVKTLWHDPNQVGWKPFTAYKWTLQHRPKTGRIRVVIYEGSEMIADSGDQYDFTLRGGRLGFFVFSQPTVIWSDLSYACADN